MTIKDNKIPYMIGVAVVLIGVLYALSFTLKGGPANDDAVAAGQVVSAPVTASDLKGDVDPSNMYLGMKAWNWVSAKSADGKVTTPSGGKPFTLTFDFNKGTFSATTDCNTVGGSFAAESGAVAFGEMSSTLMYCENSQESAFTTLLAESKGFYFTTKGEMVLTQKDGGTVSFR